MASRQVRGEADDAGHAWITVRRAATQIGVEMGVSVKTVSTYRRRMLEKLALSSNAEATRYVLEHRLLEDASG